MCGAFNCTKWDNIARSNSCMRSTAYAKLIWPQWSSARELRFFLGYRNHPNWLFLGAWYERLDECKTCLYAVRTILNEKEAA